MNSAQLYGLPLYEITRPFLFGFQLKPVLVFPLFLMFLLIIALSYSLINFYSRKEIWIHNTSSKTLQKPQISQIFSRFIFNSPPGQKVLITFSHRLLFAAFALYISAGSIYLVNVFISRPLFSYNLLFGYQYIVWTFVTDSAGILIILAILIDMFLRYVVRPQNQISDRRHFLFNLLLLLTVLSGYGTEGVRIALNGFPLFEKWSFAGYFTGILLSPLQPPMLEQLYSGLTIVYILCIMLLAARLGSARLFGTMYPFFNVSLAKDENLSPRKKYMFTTKTEFGDILTYFGANSITELSYETVSSCDACTECGTCNDFCPAVLSETKLSPKDIIRGVKQQLHQLEKNEEISPFVPNVISSEAVYSCLDCGACNEVCPSLIRPMSLITEIKKNISAESLSIPEHITQLYRNVESTGSVYNTNENRNEYILSSGLVRDVRNTSDYDYLLFVGCYYGTQSFGKNTLLNFLKLCRKNGIRVGILGEDEMCCGDTALRSGNHDLFFSCASHNLNLFRKYGITKIITMCPHGYNILRKEYRKVSQVLKKSDEYIEVFHYTDILHSILQNKQINFTSSLNKRIVYHDSCFLGRFNNYYSIPRSILSSLPGADYQEMNRHGQLSVCCGSSGAIAEHKKRTAYKLGEFRAMDGVTAGANIIAASCPFCENSIKEGLRDIQQDHIEVKNIIDIVYQLTE